MSVCVHSSHGVTAVYSAFYELIYGTQIAPPTMQCLKQGSGWHWNVVRGKVADKKCSISMKYAHIFVKLSDFVFNLMVFEKPCIHRQNLNRYTFKNSIRDIRLLTNIPIDEWHWVNLDDTNKRLLNVYLFICTLWLREDTGLGKGVLTETVPRPQLNFSGWSQYVPFFAFKVWAKLRNV